MSRAFVILAGTIGVAGSAIAISPGTDLQRMFAASIGVGGFAASYVLATQAEELEARLMQQQQLTASEAAFWQQRNLQFQAQLGDEEQIAILQAHKRLAQLQAKNYLMQAVGATAAPIEPVAALPAAEPTPVAESPAAAPNDFVARSAIAVAPPEPAVSILDEIVTSQRSTIMASPTGTGKSLTQAYILNRLFTRFPKAQAWGISQKNDSFSGLREAGRIFLFDPLDPLPAFKGAVDTVYDIFDRRRRSLEGARSHFRTEPVRLILSDWHSIWNAVQDQKWFRQNYAPKLSTIVTVGRELNVTLIVDTQSYNLKSLGVAEDSNIRNNLNIVCQGYEFVDEFGQTQGDYKSISNLLRNAYLVPSDAEELQQRLEVAIRESRQTQTPVIYSSIGNQIQILPDLKAFKEKTPKPPVSGANQPVPVSG